MYGMLSSLHPNLCTRPSRSIFILVVGIVATGCVPRQEILEPNPWIIGEGERPMIYVHGGAKDLWPENTMMAFEGSVEEYDVDVLEIDLCLTKDDILVCHHDLTIDARSDGSGEVISFTFEELQQFNFGDDFQPVDQPGVFPYRNTLIPVPALRDVFDRFAGTTLFNVEIKNPGEDGKRAGEILADMINSLGLEQDILVASFHDEVLAHFQAYSDNRIATSTARGATEDFVFSSLGNMEFLFRPGAVAVQVPTSSAGINLATSDIIQAAHRRDMAIQYWTINDAETMRTLIQLGADGIITDRPDVMLRVLAEMGW